MNPAVSHLSLYDVANVKGVAADIGHVNTKAKVGGYEGPDALAEALKGCDMVIIPAGVPRKPGMTRDDLFKVRSRQSSGARGRAPPLRGGGCRGGGDALWGRVQGNDSGWRWLLQLPRDRSSATQRPPKLRPLNRSTPASSRA